MADGQLLRTLADALALKNKTHLILGCMAAHQSHCAAANAAAACNLVGKGQVEMVHF